MDGVFFYYLILLSWLGDMERQETNNEVVYHRAKFHKMRSHVLKHLLDIFRTICESQGVTKAC